MAAARVLGGAAEMKVDAILIVARQKRRRLARNLTAAATATQANGSRATEKRARRRNLGRKIPATSIF